MRRFVVVGAGQIVAAATSYLAQIEAQTAAQLVSIGSHWFCSSPISPLCVADLFLGPTKLAAVRPSG